ncbi:MAG: hypothetical protein ACRD3N_16595 [Terracidiphilus sp.]
MPKSVHITTPPLSSEEEAKRLGIPKHRQKELRALAEEFVKQLRAKEKAVAGAPIEREEKRKNASAAD